jgi:hypothetical protein
MGDFIDIFQKIEQTTAESKPVPGIKEFWRELPDGSFICKLTNRKLLRPEFKRYQDRSACGSMGFLVETLTNKSI